MERRKGKLDAMKDVKYAHARDFCGMYVQKCRIAETKAAFNKKETLFTSKLDLNLSKKTSKLLHFEYNFVW